MKIAFVGKGGSGKTTLASLFAQQAQARGFPVLAIDADINQHLTAALGNELVELPPMGTEIDLIKEYVRGTNTKIADISQIIKTTPPGRGSRLISLGEENPIYQHFSREIGGVRVMATGDFTDEDLGVKCYHSKTGAVELFLNHLVDKKDEFVVVDMTAGADAFASGLFTRFDITYIVVEPTIKSYRVYEQYLHHANEFKVHTKAVGNKVEFPDDLRFLQERIGDRMIAMFGNSRFIRDQEKGIRLPISDIEPKHREALDIMIDHANSQPKDWEKYFQQAVLFHERNAKGWANTNIGVDITLQVDPDFSYPDKA